jgi:hypothetical protein
MGSAAKTDESVAGRLWILWSTYLVLGSLPTLVLKPVQDLDGAVFFQYAAADNDLSRSATMQSEDVVART